MANAMEVTDETCGACEGTGAEPRIVEEPCRCGGSGCDECGGCGVDVRTVPRRLRLAPPDELLAAVLALDEWVDFGQPMDDPPIPIDDITMAAWARVGRAIKAYEAARKEAIAPAPSAAPAPDGFRVEFPGPMTIVSTATGTAVTVDRPPRVILPSAAPARETPPACSGVFSTLFDPPSPHDPCSMCQRSRRLHPAAPPSAAGTETGGGRPPVTDPEHWHLCRHDILKIDCAECRSPSPATEAKGGRDGR
jgi:hypothetical protein